MRFLLILALTVVTACTTFPDLGAQIDANARNAAYPTLQPLAPVLAKAANAQSHGQITAASEAAFDDRIARLRTKSAALRGPIIDSATRARMRRGVAVPAAIR